MLNLSSGRHIITSGRALGKTTACEMFSDKYANEGYRVCIATKNAQSLYLHKRTEALEPRYMMGKYFDYVLMDEAATYDEREFLSCLTASENIIAISTPRSGSYFNDFYINCDWHKLRFYHDPSTNLIRYYTDELYKEEILGQVK